MGGQAAPQAGAPDAAGPGGPDVVDEGADIDGMDESAETDATDAVTNDLEQFSGASSHPSEPVTRPDHPESAAVESPAVESPDAASADAGRSSASSTEATPSSAGSAEVPGPAKTDADTQ
jgi:hypothetical protein